MGGGVSPNLPDRAQHAHTNETGEDGRCSGAFPPKAPDTDRPRTNTGQRDEPREGAFPQKPPTRPDPRELRTKASFRAQNCSSFWDFSFPTFVVCFLFHLWFVFSSVCGLLRSTGAGAADGPTGRTQGTDGNGRTQTRNAASPRARRISFAFFFLV